MEEWKEYKFGEVIEKVIDNRGKSAPKSEEKFQPIIEINSLGEREPNYGMVRKWVSEETYNTWFRSGHPIVGDILVPTVGTIGIVSLMCENKGCIAQNIIALRVNRKAYNLYIYYYLKSSYVKQQLLNLNIGGVQPSIKVPHLLNLDISLPSLPTQQKIANILSSLDDKIEVNRRINEQLEELAQALFKSWFVDFGTIKLGDVVTTTSGGTPSRKYPEYYDGNYGWVKSKELNGSFIIDTEEKITEQAISKSAAKMLPEKSVLIAMYGATVGQYALLSSPMSCNQAVCALLPNENYPYTYLFMFAKNKKEELINKAVGSAQQNISQVLIKDLDISNDILKIKQFHTIVNPFFETIEKNQQEITRLTTLRDTLLPKLMSGDIAIE